MRCQYEYLVYPVISCIIPQSTLWHSGLNFLGKSRGRLGKTEINSSDFCGIWFKRKNKFGYRKENVNFFIYFTLVFMECNLHPFPYPPLPSPQILLLRMLDILASWHLPLPSGPLGWAFSKAQAPWVRNSADRSLGLYGRLLSHPMMFTVSLK